jgi:hypothetical protein
MKASPLLNKIGFALALIFVLGLACEYDAPVSPWAEAQKQPTVVPVIQKVLPEEARSASEIKIMGENFSPVPAKNLVYFNNVAAIIKSATASEIVVYRPKITGNGLTIKVIVEGALGIGKYSPYQLTEILSSFGLFLDGDAIICMTMDKDENTYVILRANDNNLIKLTPDGKRDDSFTATVTRYATDLAVGPGGFIYIVRKRDQVYRVPPTGTTVENYAKFASSAAGQCLDFDQNGNIFAGGEKTGLLLLRPDKTSAKLGLYTDFNVKAIRVFNNYVYVLASYMGTDPSVQPSGVYRNQILTTAGEVGPNELVLDWATTGDYQTATFNSFTFDANGDMYVGTNHAAPVLFAKKDGSMAPLYYGMIAPSADQIVWGNQKYLYLLRNQRMTKAEGGGIIRIDMDKLGAPYYGRTL